ncbi:MAG: hypothetical protein QNK37_18010 [Acidobacteriota bacterium]|nr:hypothetical protein [Acidobacteriota bacterium]
MTEVLNVYWEYELFVDGRWEVASASGQNPHQYGSREELMNILKIIHPGEKVRLLRIEEVVIPRED